MTDPKPVEGRPAKAADDWLDAYRAKARAATTTLLALCVTLGVAWIALIEPAITDLTSYVTSEDTETQNAQYTEERDALAQEVQAREDQKTGAASAAPSPVPGEGVFPAAVARSRTVMTVSVASSEEIRLKFMRLATEVERAEYDRLSTLIESNKAVKAQFSQPATFDLLGAEIPLSKQWIVLAWATTLLGLLVYAGIQRQMLVQQLLKAKDAFDQAASAISDVGDFAGESPFWLAPIGTLYLKPKRREAVQRALGWTPRDARIAHTTVAFFLIAFFAVGLRVAWIGFLVTDDQDRVNRLIWQGDTTTPILAAVALVALLVAALVLAVIWVVPLRLQDPGVVIARRDLVIGGGALVVVSIATTLATGRLVNWSGDRVKPDRESVRIAASRSGRTGVGPPEPSREFRFRWQASIILVPTIRFLATSPKCPARTPSSGPGSREASHPYLTPDHRRS